MHGSGILLGMDIRTLGRQILDRSEEQPVTTPAIVVADDESFPVRLTIQRSDAPMLASHEFGPGGYRLVRSGFPRIAFHRREDW